MVYAWIAKPTLQNVTMLSYVLPLVAGYNVSKLKTVTTKAHLLLQSSR